MSQDFTTETYEPSATFSVNLTDIEDNFATLKSNFSGTGNPSSPVAGQAFFHNTKKNLQIRNQANNAWLGVFYGSTSFKIWKYLNAAEDGWVQDSSITDKVLAIKGGSVYLTGGTTVGGSWIIAGNSLNTTGSDHIHKFYKYNITSYDSNGNEVTITWAAGEPRKTISHTGDGSPRHSSVDLYTKAGDGTHSHDIQSSGAWRVAAQVGILVYPNV